MQSEVWLSKAVSRGTSEYQIRMGRARMGQQMSLKGDDMRCMTTAWLLTAPRSFQGHSPGFLQNGGERQGYRGLNRPPLLDLLADLGQF